MAATISQHLSLPNSSDFSDIRVYLDELLKRRDYLKNALVVERDRQNGQMESSVRSIMSVWDHRVGLLEGDIKQGEKKYNQTHLPKTEPLGEREAVALNQEFALFRKQVNMDGQKIRLLREGISPQEKLLKVKTTISPTSSIEENLDCLDWEIKIKIKETEKSLEVSRRLLQIAEEGSQSYKDELLEWLQDLQKNPVSLNSLEVSRRLLQIAEEGSQCYKVQLFEWLQDLQKNPVSLQRKITKYTELIHKMDTLLADDESTTPESPILRILEQHRRNSIEFTKVLNSWKKEVAQLQGKLDLQRQNGKMLCGLVSGERKPVSISTLQRSIQKLKGLKENAFSVSDVNLLKAINNQNLNKALKARGDLIYYIDYESETITKMFEKIRLLQKRMKTDSDSEERNTLIEMELDLKEIQAEFSQRQKDIPTIEVLEQIFGIVQPFTVPPKEKALLKRLQKYNSKLLTCREGFDEIVSALSKVRHSLRKLMSECLSREDWEKLKETLYMKLIEQQEEVTETIESFEKDIACIAGDLTKDKHVLDIWGNLQINYSSLKHHLSDLKKSFQKELAEQEYQEL